MFISTPVYQSMLDAGVQLIDSGDGNVDLLIPSSPLPVRVQVKAWTRPIGPAFIARLAAQQLEAVPLLLVAPSFSADARRAIEEHEWSWIASSDQGPVFGHLQVPGSDPVQIGSHPEALTQARRASVRGRKPWQRYAIIRHLLLGNAWTQANLVEVCQVTQPRVSQVLKELHAAGLVARMGSPDRQEPARWIAVNVTHLIDHWLSTYPGPGGAAPTYWYGLDNIVDQAMAVHAHLDRAALSSSTQAVTPVVSGDAAADFIAPYRRSQLAVIYSRSGVDLSPLGLTPASREHATLKLVVPMDASVWPHPVDDRSRELAPNAPFALADPLQVAWDLLESDGHDADQAAAAVKSALVALRTGDRWP